MKNAAITLDEFHVAGLTCRTNLKSEMDPTTAKIGATLQSYFSKGTLETLPHRKQPGTTYCIYTDYTSDYTGDYSYYVGEELTSASDLPEDLSPVTIPAQRYVKFTVGPGPMPEICINAWQTIWALSPEELGGTRNYIADFEVYDQRASHPKNTTLDIYIGIADQD